LTSTVVIQAKRGIGDVIWHVPFIRAIAAATPEGAVTFLTPPSSMGAELLQAETCVARTLYFEHGGSELARAFQLLRLTQMLRELQPKTVWILDKTMRPALAAFLARIPQRIGMGIRPQRFLITNQGLDPSYDEVYPIECLVGARTDWCAATDDGAEFGTPVERHGFDRWAFPWSPATLDHDRDRRLESRQGLVQRTMDGISERIPSARARHDFLDRRTAHCRTRR
jgi:hypothetical protein